MRPGQIIFPNSVQPDDDSMQTVELQNDLVQRGSIDCTSTMGNLCCPTGRRKAFGEAVPIMNSIELRSSVKPTDLRDQDLPGLASSDRYILTATISKALFGSVVLAFDRKLLRQVAIKISFKSLADRGISSSGKRVLESVQRQHAFLREFERHEHFRAQSYYARHVDELEDGQYHYSVVEYAHLGDLFNVLKSMSNNRIDSTYTRIMFRNLVRSVADLHAWGVAHNDLSLENVCVCPDGSVKLIDFALAMVCPGTAVAKLVDPSTTDGAIIFDAPYEFIRIRGKIYVNPGAMSPGKIGYMSPELYGKRKWDPFANDVWSLGVILYAMLVGIPPYTLPVPEDPWFQIVCNGKWTQYHERDDWLTNPGYVFRHLSRAEMDLIGKMLRPEETRINLTEVLAHPWLTSPNRVT